MYVVKARKIAGSEHFGCGAHCLHNLIGLAVEGISNVQTIICKVKDINKTFTFKSCLPADLSIEQLVVDLECVLEDIDKDLEIGFDSWEDRSTTWYWYLESSFFRWWSRNSIPTAMYNYIEEGLPNRMELFVVHDGYSLLINQELVELCLLA